MSSSVSGSSWNSWQRDRSAEFTSKYGFSVVAPISVTRPDSTAGRSASCWPLLNRWISSRKRIVRCPFAPSRSRASPSTRRTSATPTCTAESSSKWACVVWATIRARVVLPLPGVPKKIIDGTRSEAIARRRALPSPTTPAWPTNSSIVPGRSRCASGATVASRDSAECEKRSAISRNLLRPIVYRPGDDRGRCAHGDEPPPCRAHPHRHLEPARERDRRGRAPRRVPGRGGRRSPSSSAASRTERR